MLNASPTPGSPGSGNNLTITAGAQLALGGTVYGATAGVVAVGYINHCAFQQNSGLFWFGPITATNSGGPLSSSGSPMPTILLSNNVITTGAAAGSAIGTISVTTGKPDGSIGTGAYPWTLTWSGSARWRGRRDTADRWAWPSPGPIAARSPPPRRG